MNRIIYVSLFFTVFLLCLSGSAIGQVVWPLDSVDKRLPNAGFVDSLSTVEARYISEIKRILSENEDVKPLYFEKISKAIENKNWFLSFQFVESLSTLLLSEGAYEYLFPHLKITYGMNPYDTRRPNYIGNYPVSFAIHKSASLEKKTEFFESLLSSDYFHDCLFQDHEVDQFYFATFVLFSKVDREIINKASRKNRAPCHRKFFRHLLQQ